jgi:biotin synthase
MTDIVRSIREGYPDCAITLSIGEKTYDQYLKYYQAGANRYLLRHETANPEHYAKLHPHSLSLENRKECLRNLKKIGYQVGTGFMVGSPYQTPECLAEDLLFIKELSPHMVGIGPFIPHKDTQFAGFPAGSVDLTLFLIGLIRLMLPNALIPATTALGTLDSKGREKGILSGSNVLMPNLSPIGVRKKYDLYDNKICTGEEAAECNVCLRNRVASVGYQVVEKRGDWQGAATIMGSGFDAE